MAQRALPVAVLALLVSSLLPRPALAHESDVGHWMGDLAVEAPFTMDQTLAEFIFPGTHDSGTYSMSAIAACSGCAGEGNISNVFLGGLAIPWAKTQSESILGQLELGARAFDLRFYRATQNDLDRTFSLFTGFLEKDKFYIHHSVTGPTSDVIFNDIKLFLVDQAHSQEILILNFSAMREDDGEMSPGSLADFFRSLFTTVMAARPGVPLFAPKSLGPGATLRELQTAGHQIIVSYKGKNTPALDPTNPVDKVIIDSIWPAIRSVSFSGPGGYPKADDWNTEAKLFAEMKSLGQRRTDDNQLFEMRVPMGVDDDGVMLKRSACCLDVGASIFCETVDLLGVDIEFTCPAINDDWDSFQSLADVAEWTNSRLLPALVGLPRRDVNIVTTDFYPAEFTREVKKLNRGAARVDLTILEVEELECHDCASLTPDPDYYPKITFLNDVEWPNWGGAHLETSGDPIKPGWRAVRALPEDATDVIVRIEIFDEDNDPDADDKSQIDGNAEFLDVTIPVASALQSGLDFRWVASSRGDTGLDEFNSSSIVFAPGVCAWASCESDNPPQAVLAEIGVIEGFPFRLGGSGSFDLDIGTAGEITAYEWDFDYKGDIDCAGRVDVTQCEAARSAAFSADLTTFTPFARSPFPARDGPDTFVAALRVTDATGNRSNIDAREIQVFNQPPVINAFEVLPQSPPAFSTATATIRFHDNGIRALDPATGLLGDEPFTCEVFYQRQGGGQQRAVGDVVRGTTSIDPVSGVLSVNYTCNASLQLTERGIYDAFTILRDKDGALALGNRTIQFTVVTSQVTTIDALVLSPEPAPSGSQVTALATITDRGVDDGPYRCIMILGQRALPAEAVVMTGVSINPPGTIYICGVNVGVLDAGIYAFRVEVVDANDVLTTRQFNNVEHVVVFLAPDVVGLAQASAEAAIVAAGLTVGNVTTANSATVPVGNVINQTPAGGTQVAEGSSVDLVVSLGPVIVTVPDVVGLQLIDVRAALIAVGLDFGTLVNVHNDTVPAGHVISQNPAAGAQVGPGAPVDLVVSLGPALVSAPDVIGLTQAGAEAAIVAAGLTVGTVTTANSDTVPAGHVISQNPAAGAQVGPGAPVDLVVSLGPAPALRGNLDGDDDVDTNDMNIVMAAINTPASDADDPRDLDGDGMITVLDARILVTQCTRPQCATE